MLRLSSKLRFAIKVSLSLTLSYMIPMAMGWAQPNTAAMTVMHIPLAFLAMLTLYIVLIDAYFIKI